MEVKKQDDVGSFHQHCEHCIMWKKCREAPKSGWSCEIIHCLNLCGQRFHRCKLEEHKLMCQLERIECLNKAYGCSQRYPRYFTSEHLPICPASVVVCSAQWNRWAMGAKDREKVALQKGVTELYDPHNIDIALALHDQELVNDMQQLPKWIRKMFCNKITRRFPCLPLTFHGCDHNGPYIQRFPSHSSTGGEENNSISEKVDNLVQSDDISELCCVHGILKDICLFCRDDPEVPNYTLGKVWRERISLESPGHIKWIQEPRIEKVKKRDTFGRVFFKSATDSDDDEDENKTNINSLIVDEMGRPVGSTRFRTPPPAPLTSESLNLELSIKHYCSDQKKPRAMLTFQCMQEMRRDEFCNHYKNVHSEIHEGLDGWLLQRCPLHIYGCPFFVTKLYPGQQQGMTVVYNQSLQAFGMEPIQHSDGPSRSNSESSGKKHFSPLNCDKIDEAEFFASSLHITYLPIELLQNIARFLDSYSLNNLAVSCKLMREVCLSLLPERGMVIQEWVRYIQHNIVTWKPERFKWFFSKSFDHIENWKLNNIGELSNHLQICKFNERYIANNKFSYVPLDSERHKLMKKTNKLNSE